MIIFCWHIGRKVFWFNQKKELPIYRFLKYVFLLKFEIFEVLFEFFVCFLCLFITILHKLNMIILKIKRSFENFWWYSEQNSSCLIKELNLDCPLRNRISKICHKRIWWKITLIIFHAFPTLIFLLLSPCPLLLSIEKLSLHESLFASWLGAHFEDWGNKRHSVYVIIIFRISTSMGIFLLIYVLQISKNIKSLNEWEFFLLEIPSVKVSWEANLEISVHVSHQTELRSMV